MNIATIAIKHDQGWRKVEEILQEWDSSFKFENGKVYTLQLQSGAVRLCVTDDAPKGDEGAIFNDSYGKELYKKGQGDLYVKVSGFDIAKINVSQEDIMNTSAGSGSSGGTTKTKLSEFVNDVPFVTMKELEGFATKDDVENVVKAEDIADVAKKSDIAEINETIAHLASKETIDLMEAKIKILENQVGANILVDGEEKTQAGTFTDVSANIIFTGDVKLDAEGTSKYVANSITVQNNNITNNKLSMTATKDIEMSNVSISGKFDASKGTILVMEKAEYVTVKDTAINPMTAYNGIEIGLSNASVPKVVTIANCVFGGQFKNNAISIHATQDNAIINISNCIFEDVSNVIRLSNRLNSKNVIINITNCSCKKWEQGSNWAGMLICQDHINKTAEAAATANVFGDGKITINVTNFTKPDGTVLAPTDLSTICGTKDDKQIFYVYAGGEIVAYDETRYPIINIKG